MKTNRVITAIVLAAGTPQIVGAAELQPWHPQAAQAPYAVIIGRGGPIQRNCAPSAEGPSIPWPTRNEVC